MSEGSRKFFKNYKRQRRVAVPEEDFSKGMDFSTAPIQKGFMKQMVNYDWAGVRNERITPRPGLVHQTTDIYTGATVYSSDMLLIDGKECPEVDNNVYNQVITGQVTGTKLTDTDLYLGTGEVNTGIGGVLTREDMQTGVEKIMFTKPSSAEIHGVPVVELDNIAEHVGAFAYNDDYYYFKDTGVLHRTNFNAGSYEVQSVPPKELNPKEAVMWGYNMLSSTPYVFNNNVSGVGTIVMSGILPYIQGTTDLEMNPEVNEDLTLECFYNVGTGLKYDFIWEWKEVQSSSWVEIKKETITFDTEYPLRADISFPTPNVMVRLTAFGHTGGSPNATADQVMTVGIAVNKKEYGETDNVDEQAYDLHTATGMTYWKKRLMLYGVKEDSTILFSSEVNDPSYFPYPNNIDIFEAPIIHCQPLGDTLLVFTKNALYNLSLTPDGLGWTKQMIQSDLAISKWDLHLIQTVKNMLFFKSGNYFYMVVPSVKAPTGLTIAPISKPIEFLFDSFEHAMAETMSKLYDYKDSLELVHYYNYLDYEDIHNVYVFRTVSGLYINIALLYNVMSRAWKMYTHESQHIVKSYKNDATKKGTFFTLFNFNNKPSIQYLKYDVDVAADYYLLDGIASIEANVSAFESAHLFPNYQLLDTGLREHNSDYKKRYREVQIKFNNISQQNLKFYTLFSIDGEVRKNIEQYTLNHVIDPLSPDFGLITMDRSLVDPDILPGATVLAEDENDDQSWVIDQNVFPEVFLWKVRIPVSGKGYAPRLVIISYNPEKYELMSTSFVFRDMYSR